LNNWRIYGPNRAARRFTAADCVAPTSRLWIAHHVRDIRSGDRSCPRLAGAVVGGGFSRKMAFSDQSDAEAVLVLPKSIDTKTITFSDASELRRTCWRTAPESISREMTFPDGTDSRHISNRFYLSVQCCVYKSRIGVSPTTP
jgi:hypothetical protein